VNCVRVRQIKGIILTFNFIDFQWLLWGRGRLCHVVMSATFVFSRYVVSCPLPLCQVGGEWVVASSRWLVPVVSFYTARKWRASPLLGNRPRPYSAVLHAVNHHTVFVWPALRVAFTGVDSRHDQPSPARPGTARHRDLPYYRVFVTRVRCAVDAGV